MKHRLHVVALPHIPTAKKHSACAYQQKVLKFCKMMSKRGHEVLHYGVEGSEVIANKHFDVITAEEQRRWFGHVDETKNVYPIDWDSKAEYWQVQKRRTVEVMERELKKGDFLCLIAGSQKPIADHFRQGRHYGPKLTTAVEFGVGYYGTFAPHCVYESYAHMHAVYCQWRDGSTVDGRTFDAVIPNYFDVDDFPFVRIPAGMPTWNRTNDPYCLFLGRLIQRKGLALAVEATRRAGIKLIVAGQGEAHILKDGVLQVDGMRLNAKHVGFVGYADPKKRADLMGNAQSFICPTQYLEPFGGVGVEAQLCGTPVISTDWGAFTETVEHGVSGYRCRTMEQFVWALKNADRLDRMIINTRARRLYSLERVGAMYEEYFDMLSTLWGDGFNADRPREQLDWLTDPFVEGSLWPSR